MTTISKLIIDELKHETKLSERFLERVPSDQFEWQPHEKSMKLGQLSNHLAEIPGWVTATISQNALDMANYNRPDFKSVDEILAILHSNHKAAIESLEGMSDGEFQQVWSMRNGAEVLLSLPKYQVLRKVVLPQMPHHRAQLGVYLRMLNQNVPATYGPSADEKA